MQIQVIHVSENGLTPDPLVVHINDVVIWEFPKKKSKELVRVKTEADLIKYVANCKDIVPRRFMSRSFKDPGVYHFVSSSLDSTVSKQQIEHANGLDVCEINNEQLILYITSFLKCVFTKDDRHQHGDCGQARRVHECARQQRRLPSRPGQHRTRKNSSFNFG